MSQTEHVEEIQELSEFNHIGEKNRSYGKLHWIEVIETFDEKIDEYDHHDISEESSDERIISEESDDEDASKKRENSKCNGDESVSHF
jgi:hypothetical protein